MEQKLYQVDAFANKLFSGNPAAVCPLKEWLSEELMQKIAMENNLSETAFYVKKGEGYEIRWFTPAAEVDLCGHATLAAAFVLFSHEGHPGEVIRFESPRSGMLPVTKKDRFLTLDFPADEALKSTEVDARIAAAFSLKPRLAFRGKTDLLLIYDSEEEVKTLVPDLKAVSELGGRGVIVSARGDEADFVSRFFAPQVGVNEDPVTGSAHTTLTPYWSKILNKKTLSAIQLSRRTGYLWCTDLGNRIQISGECRLYSTGAIYF